MWDSISSLVDTASSVFSGAAKIAGAAKAGFDAIGAWGKENGDAMNGSFDPAQRMLRPESMMHDTSVSSPGKGKTLVAPTTPKPQGNDGMDMARRLAELEF